MRTVLIIFFTIYGFIAFPQYSDIPENLLNKANTAKDASYLSRNEKDVILYINLARINGKWFVKNIINANNDFVNSNSKNYVRSLISNLENLDNLAPLYPAKSLTNAARYHAKDMGISGKTGHRSSDGTDTFTRIKKFAKGGYMAENCQYGFNEPVKIVLDLLIDEGIPSLGHRKNILTRIIHEISFA